MHRKHGGGEHQRPPPARRRSARRTRRDTRWACPAQVHNASVPKFVRARRRCGKGRGVCGHEAC
jgi:hypothetical protein